MTPTEPGRVARKVFVTCWAVCAIHWTPFVVREHFAAIALAESGTFNVERFEGMSADIFPGPRGGAYINNNPGASLLGAVPLIVWKPVLHAIKRWNQHQPVPIVAPGADFEVYRKAIAAREEWYYLAVAFVTVAFLMAPATALSASALCRVLQGSGVHAPAAAGVALLFAFGTPVFFRTGYLNHNLLVAHAAWLALLLLWDPGRGPLRPGRAAGAGALAGLAVLLDYSGAIALLIVALYAALRAQDTLADRTRWVGPFLAGLVPPLLVLGAYQLVAFGSAGLPAQHFMRPTAPTQFGYRGFDWPSPSVAWANFFNPRFGLFVYCPLLLLGLAAPFLRRTVPGVPRRETRVILAFFWLLVVFSAANRYSMLQYTTGLRYLVPVVPGLVLLSAEVLAHLPSVIRRLLVLSSVLSSWLLAVTHDGWQTWTAGGPPGGIQLTWARRMADLGLLASPGLVSVTVLSITAIAFIALWRRDLSCAF